MSAPVIYRERAVWLGPIFQGFYFDEVQADGSVTAQLSEEWLTPSRIAGNVVERMSAAAKSAVLVQYFGYDPTDWNPAEWEATVWQDGAQRVLSDAELRANFERVDKAGNVSLRPGGAFSSASIHRKSEGHYDAASDRFVRHDEVWAHDQRWSTLTEDERTAWAYGQWVASTTPYDPQTATFRAWLAARPGLLEVATAKMSAPIAAPSVQQAAAPAPLPAVPGVVPGGLANLFTPSPSRPAAALTPPTAAPTPSGPTSGLLLAAIAAGVVWFLARR